MTHTVVLGGESGGTAGIVLKSSQKIGVSENKEAQEETDSRKFFLEILFPAGTVLPKAGTPFQLLPQGRPGSVLTCRITGSNSLFLRSIAEVRLDKPSRKTGIPVKSPRNKQPWQ